MTIPGQNPQKPATLPTIQAKPDAEDDKIEFSYTDPQEQLIQELREKMGLMTDAELKERNS